MVGEIIEEIGGMGENEDRARAAILAKAKSIMESLSPNERATLKEAATTKGALRISAEDEAKFLSLSLAEKKFGGLGLTPLGRLTAGLVPSE